MVKKPKPINWRKVEKVFDESQLRRRFNRDRVINYVQGFLLGFSVGALVMALVSGVL